MHILTFYLFLLFFIKKVMEMNEQNFSNELKDVLAYMVDVLDKEYPTILYSPEYIISSILDSKKCHAYIILKGCLMSYHLDEMKSIYNTWLKNNSLPSIVKKRGGNIRFNEELQRIVDGAEKERNEMNSENIGTEHILLAMLNPNNNLKKIIDVFKNIGLDYNIVKQRCTSKNRVVSNAQNDQKSKNINKNGNLIQFNIDPTKMIHTQQKSDFIDQYTININEYVKSDSYDKLVGREKEMNQIIQTLARRQKNNVIIVGKSGCGKTSLVYGIADLINKCKVPQMLMNKEIVMLNMMSLISGTHFRGMFEERINGLFNELKNSNKYILFIDDIHTVLKSSQKEKDSDISGVIGNVLQGGEVSVIGTTSFKDYRNSIESNSSIARKLQKVIIEPTTIDETIEIVKQNKKYYEEHHNVFFKDDVIKRIVELSYRYITDRSLPDSAIDVIDLSGAKTCFDSKEPSDITEARKRLTSIKSEKNHYTNEGDFNKIDELEKEENTLKLMLAEYNRNESSYKEKYRTEITFDHIASAISDMCGVPINKLNVDEKKQIANLDKTLKKYVIGQDEAIDTITRVIKRNKIGLGNKEKTLANILLVGKSGTGKTLIAKKLAQEVFGSETNLVRIDMSEYSDKSSVTKLCGSNPGYIGFENGGQLTEAIKNKQHCVLLLDEIEKANAEVFNLFLQVFDEGRLTDNSGQLVNFKNVIILMTSNIGTKKASEFGNNLGFVNDGGNDKTKNIIDKELKKTFMPEFLNRIDKIVFFNSLTDDNLRDIVKLELNQLEKRINEINYNIQFNDETIDYIHRLAITEKEYGARPIKRLIQTNIEDKITDLILNEDFENNYTFKTSIENEELVIN